jgi:hypothetical protein
LVSVFGIIGTGFEQEKGRESTCFPEAEILKPQNSRAQAKPSGKCSCPFRHVW